MKEIIERICDCIGLVAVCLLVYHLFVFIIEAITKKDEKRLEKGKEYTIVFEEKFKVLDKQKLFEEFKQKLLEDKEIKDRY